MVEEGRGFGVLATFSLRRQLGRGNMLSLSRRSVLRGLELLWQRLLGFQMRR